MRCKSKNFAGQLTFLIPFILIISAKILAVLYKLRRYFQSTELFESDLLFVFLHKRILKIY